MPDVTPNLILPPAEHPHATEVHAAQAALDCCVPAGRAGPPPGENAAADRVLLRALVAAHGADGVRKMIDSLN